MDSEQIEVLVANRAVYAAARDVLPGESVLLEHLKGRWHELKLLDLGVGAGRTAWTFGRICQDYWGVDLIPEFIESARQSLGETSSRRFVVGDAKNLARFPDAEFDLVMFSHNGMDHSPWELRSGFFREYRRLLKADGLLFFSFHNLGVFPVIPAKPAMPRNWVRRVLAERRYATQRKFYQRVSRMAIAPDVVARGWAWLPDSHAPALTYVMPDVQRSQLLEQGFTVEWMVDDRGKPLSALDGVWTVSCLARRTEG